MLNKNDIIKTMKISFEKVGYHGDIGVSNTLHSYRIIFTRSDKRLEEEMTCRCFDYISALTLYYRRIGDRYSEAKLIDIIPE